MGKTYDVIILGTGPGGPAAGTYTGRACLDTLLTERGKDGGQIAITDEIENYPGQMVDGESGPSPIKRTTKQVEKFGAKRVSDTIISVDIESPVKTLVGNNGTYKAHTLIIATGAFPRPIGCRGKSELVGEGVSYCVTCDTSFPEDLEVFVVGDGGSAVEEATYLTKFAKRVAAIYRRDELRVAKSAQEHAPKNSRLFFVWGTAVEELHGDGILFGMTAKNVKTGELTRIDAGENDDLFGALSFIGHNLRSELFEGKLETDHGYIKADENVHTSMEGAYAVGNIRVKNLRQVVTAVADRTTASMWVERWLAE